MRIHKCILIWILVKQSQKAADLCEILEENSDISAEEPLIDLALTKHDSERDINQRNILLSFQMIAQVQEWNW